MPEKAWMDEQMMNKWIDLVLVPWKNAKAPGVVPVVIFDAYHIHMMGIIVNCIQSLEIEVVHISPGCTYLCQPVDVGLNKTVKTRMREKWEDWMVKVLQRSRQENLWLNGCWMCTTTSQRKLQGTHGGKGDMNDFENLIYYTNQLFIKS